MKLKHYQTGHFDLTVEHPDFILVKYLYQGVNTPIGNKGLIAFGIGTITLPTGHIALKVEFPESYYEDDSGNIYFLNDPNGASELTIKSGEQDVKLRRIDQRNQNETIQD